MKMTVDISLYPLADDYLPAIQAFIGRIQQHPDVAVVRTDLSTQLFGEYEDVMGLLQDEIRISWEKYGRGIFVIKFLQGDLRGLADV